MKKKIIALLAITIPLITSAQENDPTKDFMSFRTEILKNYKDFRSKTLSDYLQFVNQVWDDYNSNSPIPCPEREKMDPPVVYNDEPIKNDPIDKDPHIYTQPDPLPKPTPILDDYKKEKTPLISSANYEDINFEYMGTSFKVPTVKGSRPNLSSLSGSGISDFFTQLASEKNDRTIMECLTIRKEHNLCDWAYLNMLSKFSDSYLGKGNASTLMTCFLFMASGYSMRISVSDGKAHLLFASNHTIYNRQHYVIDGERFYSLDDCPNNSSICGASFPNETKLSLYISQEPGLAINSSANRNLKSERYGYFNFDVNSNLNLIKFYDSYPSSEVDNDFGTRWAMYANTPLSKMVTEVLYPSMKEKLSGLGQLEAVNVILNWVQTAFKYEYDDNVWGVDRAFFPDETIYYPYCDCEDRSILFSRLVRDILGLDVVLVYFPGHLATAVNFTNDVYGDNFTLDNRKYTICDPTYIGAPVGLTMPKYKGSKIKAVLLSNH